MNRRNTTLVFALFLAIAVGLPNAALAVDDISALIEKLKKTAVPDPGMNDEEQEIAKQLQARKAAAIPYLLPLLKDDNKAVRALAAYTLSDID